MPNMGIEDILYSKGKDPLDFKFENIPAAPPIFSFMTHKDIEILHNVATSLRYAGNIQKKYDMIDDIMTNRGFVKFHSGTNRIVYRPLESYDFIVKIALDRVGLTDSPNEFMNQALLKPFVTRVFECTPCGTMATFERVKPMIRKEEFASVAGDIFDLINKKIIGKYILDDIGTEYFMNWGIRSGFGPVLLDFPYVYQLDGDKLACVKRIPELNNKRCTGLIDYDDGYNHLVCTKCGRKYNALDLEKEDSGIKAITEGSANMKVIVRKGNKIIRENKSTDFIDRSNKKKDKPEPTTGMKVLFRGKTRTPRDLSETKEKELKEINSPKDAMERRQEIIEKQKRKKRESCKHIDPDNGSPSFMVDDDESIKCYICQQKFHRDKLTKEEVEIAEQHTKNINDMMGTDEDDELEEMEVEKGSLTSTESEVDEEEEEKVVEKEEEETIVGLTTEDLANKYKHLEDEFDDTTYEPIKPTQPKDDIKNLY